MPNAATIIVHWQATGEASKMLHTITEPKVAKDTQGEVEVIFGMSPTNEAIGFKKGQKPSYTITFNAPVLEGTQEHDWDDAADAFQTGELTIEKGDKAHIYTCMVETAEEDVDDKRTSTLNVTIKASGRRAA